MQVHLDTLDGFRVRMTFFNQAESAQRLAVDRIGGENPLNGNYFNFNPLPAPLYHGVQTPGVNYDDREVIEVLPGESVITEVDLQDYYDLSDRSPERPFQVSYRAAHPLYTSTVRVVQSNWTTFDIVLKKS